MTYEDPIVTYCRTHGLALDRETYLAACYPQGAPALSAEADADLPQFDAIKLSKRDLARAVAAWNTAIGLIDRTEPAIRDIIERGLMNVAGVNRTHYGDAMRAADAVMKLIRRVRVRAIKDAFRHLRDKLGGTVRGVSFAQLAAFFIEEDLARIDNAVRSGLIGGLDNTEIGRKVIGSMGINGIDGVTEVTRQRIAHLGRMSVKPKRKT